MTCVLRKMRNFQDRYTHTGNTPCEHETEIGVTHLQAQDHQRLAASCPPPGEARGRGRSLPEPQKEPGLPGPPARLRGSKRLLFKPPSLCISLQQPWEANTLLSILHSFGLFSACGLITEMKQINTQDQKRGPGSPDLRSVPLNRLWPQSTGRGKGE